MFTRGLGAGTHEKGRRKRIEEENVTSEERLRELEDKYEDFKVYDNRGDKIGKVDDLFVDEADREEYIGVKLGLLGRKSTLIPMDIVRVNEADKSIEVSDTKDHVKDAPSFDDDEDITGEYERRIREHFGLEASEASSGGGYAGTGAATAGESAAGGSAAGASTGADSNESDENDSQDYASGGSTAQSGATQSDVTQDAAKGSDLGGGSSDEATREVPTSRQTEETETFQEGGRTKVRRRIVREEIFDADEDPSARP